MNPIHLFICGLHRSGTSILNKIVQLHNFVTGFSGTGASEDEGQHLQRVLAHDGVFGGPGAFCFSPGARLTEADVPPYAKRIPEMIQAWEAHWTAGLPVRVEKSPPNLIRSRFLQAIFPNSRFVFIVRHPLIVSLATQKWSRSPLEILARHWIAGHSLMRQDLPYLQRWCLVRYEDIAIDTENALNVIWDLVNITPKSIPHNLFVDRNISYLKDFKQLDSKTFPTDLLEAAELFGYSMDTPFATGGLATVLSQRRFAAY